MAPKPEARSHPGFLYLIVGAALLVFMVSRTFADKEKFGVTWSLPWHCVGAQAAQRAVLAGAHLDSDLF